MPLGLYLIYDKDSIAILINCFSESRPSNCASFSGITEMNLVTLIVWRNSRNNKSNLALINETIRGVVKTSRIDRILWSKIDSKFISPFLQIIRLFIREGEIYITMTAFYSIWELIVHLFAELIQGVLVWVISIQVIVLSVILLIEFSNVVAELFLKHALNHCISILCIIFRTSRIVNFLYLHLMLADIFRNILFADISSLLFQPVGQSYPLILFLLQSTCLLNLIDPSLGIAGLHRNLVKGCKSIRDEYVLISIRNWEANVIWFRIESLWQRYDITAIVICHSICWFDLIWREETIIIC